MTKYGGYILVVEDNPADSHLISSALSDGDKGTRVVVAKDGVEAFQLLPHASQSPPQPRPDLIPLDLNMPRKDGRTFLSEIKADPALACIPVVVLTSSEAPEDINAAYSRHANSYFTKPPNLDDFFSMIEQIKKYWLGGVKLPTACVCPPSAK